MATSSWSQKDGTDAVINFDFGGNKITDPRKGDWQVNEGPLDKNGEDFVVEYKFVTFMFVPDTVEII